MRVENEGCSRQSPKQEIFIGGETCLQQFSVDVFLHIPSLSVTVDNKMSIISSCNGQWLNLAVAHRTIKWWLKAAPFPHSPVLKHITSPQCGCGTKSNNNIGNLGYILEDIVVYYSMHSIMAEVDCIALKLSKNKYASLY